MGIITRDFLKSKFNLVIWLIAIVLLIELVARQFQVSDQEKYGKIINISGKQRMLSQRLILLATKFKNSGSIEAYQKFSAARSEFASAHLKLSGRDKTFATVSSDKLQQVYFSENPSVDTLFNNYLVNLMLIKENSTTQEIQEAIDKSISSESELLYSLNEAVKKFENYSKDSVKNLKYLEYGLFVLILFILYLQSKTFVTPLINIVVENFEELEKSEKKLQEKNEEILKSSKEKDEFVANLSHEIRTPLNGILGMTYDLDSKLGDQQVSTSLEMIRSCTETITKLFEDAVELDILKNQQTILIQRPFALKESLNMLFDVYSREARSKGLELKLSYDDNISEFVMGDKERINQIFIYLISNAIKFTEEGFITIYVKKIPGSDNINFQVLDTGIGMSADVVEKIQKDFYQGDNSRTREFGGLGVGLSIVSRLIELHGGILKIESEVGKGSRFEFVLKMQKAEYTLKQIGSIDNPEKIKILLVEDIELNQRLTKAYLKKLNLSCDIASNGMDALEALAAIKYDLVLMDIQMPVMDGVTATKRIVELYGEERPRIIALTANVLEKDCELYRQIGMDGIISKPIKIQNFQETLFAVLEVSNSKKYYSQS